MTRHLNGKCSPIKINVKSYTGANHPNFIFNFMGSELAMTDKEKTPGLWWGSSVDMTAVEKMNDLLGIIRNGIEKKMKIITELNNSPMMKCIFVLVVVNIISFL